MPVVLAALSTAGVQAKRKPPQDPAASKQANESHAKQDQIVVQAHIPAAQGPVTRFIATRHFSRTYIYAERENGRAMLLDVTRPDHPQVLSDAAYFAGTASGSLIAAAGTAVLASDAPAVTGRLVPQTLRIMDFSDLAHPKVARQFEGVTAIERTHGLILLANPEGIWILSERLADDPELDAEYARRVVYQ